MLGSSTGCLIASILLAVASFERDSIVERITKSKPRPSRPCNALEIVEYRLSPSNIRRLTGGFLLVIFVDKTLAKVMREMKQVSSLLLAIVALVVLTFCLGIIGATLVLYGYAEPEGGRRLLSFAFGIAVAGFSGGAGATIGFCIRRRKESREHP